MQLNDNQLCNGLLEYDKQMKLNIISQPKCKKTPLVHSFFV